MNYVINLNKVLEHKNLPSWLYKCAFEIKVSQYLPAGDFFEKLDDEELTHLEASADKVKTDDFINFILESEEDEKNLENLALLCMLLALGEGIAHVEPSELSDMMTGLFILISVESQYRKNLVEAYRKNYSIMDGSKPVVKGKP